MEQEIARVVEHRRWLHRHPELAFAERETTAYVAEHLRKAGLAVRQTGESGLIADLTVDPAYPTVAIRAEMDAIEVQEETGLPFASESRGVMHACGHDANTAVLLALAEKLALRRGQLQQNVRLIFEPAEEIGLGAQHMIQNGALEKPRPSELLIFHFGNQEQRAMEIQKSVSTAGIRGLQVTVLGSPSHFSQYDEGVDAMYAAACFVTQVRRINEECATRYPFILGFGSLHAGTGGNIVAGKAELKGSLRTFCQEDFELVFGELHRRAAEIENQTGAQIRIAVTKEIPPIVNDAGMVRKGMAAGRAVFAERFMLGTEPFLVGDNAAYYLQQVPGMRVVFLAGKPGEQAYPVHNSRFDLDEKVLSDAVAFFLEYLAVRDA